MGKMFKRGRETYINRSLWEKMHERGNDTKKSLSQYAVSRYHVYFSFLQAAAKRSQKIRIQTFKKRFFAIPCMWVFVSRSRVGESSLSMGTVYFGLNEPLFRANIDGIVLVAGKLHSCSLLWICSTIVSPETCPVRNFYLAFFHNYYS